jgi:hypothetical protein
MCPEKKDMMERVSGGNIQLGDKIEGSYVGCKEERNG